jgi:malonyl-CoA O-methyltransferase
MTSRVAAELALPDVAAARRAFDRAAKTFAAASIVHDEARARLLERLTFMKIEPGVAVDLGTGLGEGAARLRERFPRSRVLAVDTSVEMLSAARARDYGPAIAGDAERLPIKDGQVGLILANMLLPWSRPDRVFREAARTLTSGGLLLFATLGPDTLEQLRRAWAAVDDRVHVHAHFDMHDLGDIAVASGLAEPVVDVDRLELTYRDVNSLVRDLRCCGAVNVASGRRRSLTGRARWSRFVQGVDALKRGGRFPVTIELILGHAWGRGTAAAAHPSPSSEAAIAVADIGFRQRPPR